MNEDNYQVVKIEASGIPEDGVDETDFEVAILYKIMSELLNQKLIHFYKNTETNAICAELYCVGEKNEESNAVAVSE